ncbi:unnamed protein product [Dicrocoelium dendriticum]|nr:unnamed protein product [Dicrocoelium dendriticum]
MNETYSVSAHCAPLASTSTVASTDYVPLPVDQLHVSFADQEVRQRDAALRRVESTIIQLGEIYQQFSTLIHDQHEVVQRIDGHAEDTELNIGSAYEHLLVYFRSVSSRRVLMLKLFVILLVCFTVVVYIV